MREIERLEGGPLGRGRQVRGQEDAADPAGWVGESGGCRRHRQDAHRPGRTCPDAGPAAWEVRRVESVIRWREWTLGRMGAWSGVQPAFGSDVWLVPAGRSSPYGSIRRVGSGPGAAPSGCYALGVTDQIVSRPLSETPGARLLRRRRDRRPGQRHPGHRRRAGPGSGPPADRGQRPGSRARPVRGARHRRRERAHRTVHHERHLRRGTGRRSVRRRAATASSA